MIHWTEFETLAFACALIGTFFSQFSPSQFMLSDCLHAIEMRVTSCVLLTYSKSLLPTSNAFVIVAFVHPINHNIILDSN
jgi:hypothetical protein